LKHSKCHVPFPSRAEVALSGAGKVRDEEQQIHSVEEYEIDDLDEDNAERYPLNDPDHQRSGQASRDHS
jgi:hypothetical protein